MCKNNERGKKKIVKCEGLKLLLIYAQFCMIIIIEPSWDIIVSLLNN